MIEIIKHTKEVKARKEHICNYCHGKIQVGETYKTQTLKYDDLYVWKEHIRCSQMVDELDIEGGDEGITDDDFSEAINAYFSNIPNNCSFEPNFQKRLEAVYNYYCK